MTYGDVHRFLLRSLASCGVLTITEASSALTQYAGNSDYGSIQDLVKKVNNQIKPFQQTIKITNDELSNEEVLVFISLGSDDATKAQNFFSPLELEFFRLLIEKIMTTDSRQVTRINALNLVRNLKTSYSKIDAEKILKTWCNMRYLEKDGNNYALGVRTIHEFEGYFRQNMPEIIEDCCLCKKIVFRGYNCPSCAEAVHTKCLNRYLENMEKWPCCQIDFNAAQLEQLNSSSRFTETQQLESPQHVTQQNTENETQTQHVEDADDLTQQIVPEISQRITRKRKYPS